jgi:UDP-sugar diphosphatase
MSDLFDITDVRLEDCPDPRWVSKAYQCNYTLRGRRVASEIGFSKDAVCVLLFNTTRKVFVFIRQFRPSVYVAQCRGDAAVGSTIDVEKHPPGRAVTLELCGGMVDKPGKDVKVSTVSQAYFALHKTLHKVQSF